MDDATRIMAGGWSKEQGMVRETEDLQNYRRPQEGRLIIAEGRALLVVEEGTKHTGPNPQKYRIDGKFDIPIGYKVIVKWDEDEIVFMTRAGTFGPDFQIIYLPSGPKESDFTLFEWNPNMQELWDQFLDVIESLEERDPSMFEKGPWVTFGVTRDEVQIALRQNMGKQTKVEGILYAENGKDPTLTEHMRYLTFDPETDADFKWVCEAFMDEPKPPNMFQYVEDKHGRVYWVNADTKESTWEHPLKKKYQDMLYAARKMRPVPDPASVMKFRMDFLVRGIIQRECKEFDDYPLLETVDNVMEMARIFNLNPGINLRDEPYLVHVLRRALRHYGSINDVKDLVVTTADVKDFKQLCYRYRELVRQYEQAAKEEMDAVKDLKMCVQCYQKEASLYCNQCRDYFCQGCFDKLHSRGRRKDHARTWVEMGYCAECQESVALFFCVQCSDMYCRDCFRDWHVRGGRRNHIPIVLRSFNAQMKKNATANKAMGPSSKQVLDVAMSPWFCFADENNIHYYHSFKDRGSQRDKPMDIINEPIADHVGGGMEGGWAGSWGSNMYSEQVDDRTRRPN